VPFNSAVNTVATLGNLSVKVQGNGYVYLTAVSGSFTWAGPAVYTINGHAITQANQTSQLLTAGNWYQVPAGYAMSSIGDQVVITVGILDTNNIYRITVLKSSNSPFQAGIVIEQLI